MYNVIAVAAPTLEQKLDLLGEQAQYDVSAPGASRTQTRDTASFPGCPIGGLEHCIYPAAAGGRCLPVLKVLMTNACRNNCAYCATRAGADVPRAGFRPEELARAFIEMETRGLVQGIFLSSAMPSEPDGAQALIVDTATILRRRYGYRGYMHLKILPGASDAAIEETVRLADRVSVNLEAPSAHRLARIAPDKNFASGLLGTLEKAVAQAAAAGIPSGVTSQYVAGAAGESDLELLGTSFDLYRRLRLRRVYYSAFRPVEGTPLENLPPTPEIREQRLYQADFLMRQYGFTVGELVFGHDGNLPVDRDPKLAWAAAHPEFFPVEINTAAREELLRVPGLGPVAVQRISAARRKGRFTDRRQLAALGVQVARAAPFITIGGRRADVPSGQLSILFSD
ncbi:MAG: helix-hairpin-helix domain-containing protein [Armatimonadetes bacterium]|nr:helix-hairpin-helix domain-containing protein [Armatimonadota bacterium]